MTEAVCPFTADSRHLTAIDDDVEPMIDGGVATIVDATATTDACTVDAAPRVDVTTVDDERAAVIRTDAGPVVVRAGNVKRAAAFNGKLAAVGTLYALGYGQRVTLTKI